MNINKLLRFKYAHKQSATHNGNVHGNEITQNEATHRTLNIISNLTRKAERTTNTTIEEKEIKHILRVCMIIAND